MIFKLVFRKKLRFDEDICWLISQDLEHLTTLHSKTNERVSIDYIVPDLSKKYLYLEAQYTTIRKILKLFTIELKTNRKIIDNKIYYSEDHNYLRTKITNTHTLTKKDNYIEHKDVIIFDCPLIIFLLSPLIKLLTILHLNSQFKEDNQFRERLQDLKNRGILRSNYIFLNNVNYKN